MTSPERRQVERIELSVPALLELPAELGGKDHRYLLTRNVSSSGAYLETAEPLPEGMAVKVEMILRIDSFDTPLEQHVYLRTSGLVARRDAMGVGVCFDPDYVLMPVAASCRSLWEPEAETGAGGGLAKGEAAASAAVVAEGDQAPPG